jgi:predicted MFS family arabinose efflux permease
VTDRRFANTSRRERDARASSMRGDARTPRAVDGSAAPEPLPGQQARRGAFASLRHRDYAVFWSAALVSNVGTWMQSISVPFLLDRLTHSSAIVGLSVFLTFFPTVPVGPLAGSLADRYSRRTILLASQSVMMVMAFAMWGLYRTGTVTSANLLVCVAVIGVANGISLPAWYAFVTQLVPKPDMLNAIRLNILQTQAARAVGPGLAGLVLATLGAGAAFFINGVSFVIVLVAVFSIRPRPIGDGAPGGRLWAHFWAGVRYVQARPVLAVPTVTIFVFGFFGQSVVQLIEPFTRQTLHLGAGAYGIVVATFGAGAIGGSLITAYREHWRRSQSFGLAATIVIGTEVAFALAPGFAAAALAMAVLGMAWTICQITLQTAVQANVDETHRGRVTSIYFISFVAGFPIGALLGGFIGDLVGLRVTFLCAALALAVFTAAMNMAYNRLHLLDQTLDDAPRR